MNPTPKFANYLEEKLGGDISFTVFEKKPYVTLHDKGIESTKYDVLHDGTKFGELRTTKGKDQGNDFETSHFKETDPGYVLGGKEPLVLEYLVEGSERVRTDKHEDTIPFP